MPASTTLRRYDDYSPTRTAPCQRGWRWRSGARRSCRAPHPGSTTRGGRRREATTAAVEKLQFPRAVLPGHEQHREPTRNCSMPRRARRRNHHRPRHDKHRFVEHRLVEHR